VGFYQRLLQTVSISALLGRPSGAHDAATDGLPAHRRPDRGRLLRTPLVFETLEPRVLLSGDIIPTAGQTAIVQGLQSFATWAQHNLPQAAQLAQQLPVVSTSLGDLVDLHDQVTNDLLTPTQGYFAANGANSTIEGLAAALNASSAAETVSALGQFADGEYLLTLTAFQTSTPITAALNLAEDAAGTGLQFQSPPTLAGHATVSMPLTFGFDPGTGHTPTTPATFFLQPGTITEGVTLQAPSFNGTVTLGAAGATVTGGTAALTATAPIQIKDPIAGDPNNYITTSELAGTTPLASLVSTSLSGTAALTLPISSALVSGGAQQTLNLNWAGDLSAVGTSNLASLNTWPLLDTLSPSLLHQAVAALPGLFQAAAGSAGFGAAVPVLGQGLGQLFNFGQGLTDAVTAVASATSLDQVAAALQTHLGATVTFTVNTGGNELDMLVTATSNFTNSVIPYAIDTPVAGANLVLNGTIQASGIATAALKIGLSFNTALADSDRISILQSGSQLSLAFDGSVPAIAAGAALGLIGVQVNNGSLAVGAQGSGGIANPASPATATINFANNNNSRTTLTQIKANPSVAFAAPTYTGQITANLPLLSADGSVAAPVGLNWYLYQGGNAAPQVTGAAQAANLNIAPTTLLTDTTLDATGVAGLQDLSKFSTAVGTAAGLTAPFSTSLPLLGASVAQLSQLSTILAAVTSAIHDFATVGAATNNFAASIAAGLASFDTSHPGFTLTASNLFAGTIAAGNATAAQALGLTPSTSDDQLVFNLSLTATYTGTQAVSLTGGAASDNVTFSTTVPYTSTVLLGLTISVTLANQSPDDTTFVRVNQLDAKVQVAATGLGFSASVGVLGATVSGGAIALTAQARAVLPGGGSAGPTFETISSIAGTNTNLLAPTIEASSLTASLPISTTFNGLAGDTATVAITGDPLSGNAPAVSIGGSYATSFQAFASLTPADVINALTSIEGTLNAVEGSSLLSQQVPLTNETVGQAADFGAQFGNDIIKQLTDSQGHATFASVQDFVTALNALSDVTAATTTYNTGSNQLAIGFTLAETFAQTTPAFLYDLTAAANTVLGDLTPFGATSSVASLTVNGSGQVTVGFNFNLLPASVQVQAGMALPSNGRLLAGDDAHFTLALSSVPAVNGTTPTVPLTSTPGQQNTNTVYVPVTVAAAATQANTGVAQLVANVNVALQQALEAAGLDATLVTVTTNYVSGGQVLVFHLASGIYTTLNLIMPPTDPAVFALGIAPAQATSSTLTGASSLPSNGKLTQDATLTITMDGGTPTPITVTAASTSGNTSPTQLLSQLQTAIAPMNTALQAAGRTPLTVALNSANRLVFTITGYGSTLMVSGNTGASIGFGIATMPQSVEAGTPVVSVEASAAPVPSNFVLTQDSSFSITVDGRSTFSVTVTAASTTANTIQEDLENEITTAMHAVNNDLAGAGLPTVLVTIDDNGHLLFTTTGANSSIVVQAASGNQLGIGSNDSSGPAQLQLVGSSNINNQVNLTKLILGGTLNVTGSLTGAGDYGSVVINTGPSPISLTGTMALSFNSNVLLSTLLANAASISSYFGSTTYSGAGSVTLPVTVPGPLGASLGLDANAKLILNAANIFQLGSWTADNSQLEGLASLQNFSFAQAKTAITQLGSFITGFAQNGLLGEKVPLVDVSLGNLLGITQDFTNLAADLQPGTNFTLDQLQSALTAAINQAFGTVSDLSVLVGLTNGVLKLTLAFAPTIASTSLPLNFDLSALGLPGQAHIPGVTDFTGSMITVLPSANVSIVLDVDLTNPTNPVTYLDQASTLDFGVAISATNLTAGLSLGPIGLYITGGTLALTAAVNSTAPATFNVALSNTQSRYNLSQLANGSFGWFGNSSPFRATVTGQVTVSLPIATTQGGTPLATPLSLTIANLGNFTTDLLTNTGNLTNDVAFSIPDLSSIFTNIDLLGNDQGIIGALDTFLGTLQTLLNGKLLSLDLPLVGNALSSAGNFLSDLKSKIDSIAGQVGIGPVQQALYNVLGPSGANLLQPPSGQSASLMNDVAVQFSTISAPTTFVTYNGSNAPSAQNIQNIQFDLNLGGDYMPTVPINFNLGLPGFGLNVQNGTVDVDLAWTLALDFGVDRTKGLYVVTKGTGNDLSVALSASLSAGATLTAQLGFLAVSATQPSATAIDPVTGQTGQSTKASLTFAAGFTGGQQTISLGSLGSGTGLPGITATFGGSAEVDLDLSLGFDFSGGSVDKSYPNFVAQLLIGGTNGAWTFSGNSLNSTAAPSVSLNDISLDFGSFLDNYLGVVLGPIAKALKPIEPVLNFLNTQIPIINTSLLQAVVELFGGDAQNVGQFFQFVTGIVDFASDFSAGGSGNQLLIPLGSFNLNSFDLRQAAGSNTNGSLPDPSTSAGFSQIESTLQSAGDLNFNSQGQIDSSAADASSTFSSDLNTAGAGSFSFPILDDPKSLIGLIFGQNVTLVQITSPELTAGASYTVEIPVWPFITADLSAGFSVDARFSAGYDTYGIVQAVAAIEAHASAGTVVADLADGLYINDAIQKDGNPATFVGISGTIAVGASVGLGDLISVGVEGGVTLTVSVSLKDSGPADFTADGLSVDAYHKSNDNDGKTRPSEFVGWIEEFGNPLCAFQLNGAVNIVLESVETLFGFSATQTLVSINLFNFSLGANCYDTAEPLGTLSGTGVLTLYTGPQWQNRDVWEDLAGDTETGPNGPSDGYIQLVKGPTQEGGDNFTVTERTPGDIIVTSDDGGSEEFKHVTGLYATLGVGKNSLTVESELFQDDGVTPINETIIGGTGNDTIQAGGGNDLIEGGGGNDQIQAGVGSDTIYGGDPSSMDTSSAGDTITGGGLGHNLIYGGSGADVIDAPGNANTVFGGPSDNTKIGFSLITGSGSGDLLVGGSGNDVIDGGSDNTIIGGGGNNLLIGGTGINVIYGGTNLAYETAESELLFGTPATTPAGRNVIFAGSGSLTLFNQYGNVAEANSLGLPIKDLPKNAATGDGNDLVYAGAHGDQIFGGQANNTIYGGAGPDTIIGGPGTDTITGGGGDSSILGRGIELIHGGSGNDTIYGGPGSSTIYGDSGNDYIQGGNSGNTINGGTGNSTIYGGDGADTIFGDTGNDYIRGQGANDTIDGGSGNVTIYGDGGADTIYGGTGKDLISGNDANDTILGGTNNDTIFGGAGGNTLFGGQGNDYISNVGGNNGSVFGGSGNTTIYGGGNNDTLSGGEGNDRIYAGLGPDQITGGSGNDTITGGGGFDLIQAGTGNDSIQGGTAGGLIHGGAGHSTIHGGAGNETIYAGALASLLTGGSGPDLLVGGATADTIVGGTGNDTIYAGALSGNVLTGGSGNDLIFGADAVGAAGQGDTISGGTGNATIYGSAGDDSIVGGSGNDVIFAGMGDPTISGGTGADVIYGGAGFDLIYGDQGGSSTAPESIYGGTGTATIFGNAGDDLLYGGAGRDSIVGGGGDDDIYGGGGTGKTILGGGGNDTIWASANGGDVITGGAGNVEIFGVGGSNTITGGAGNDTIEGELIGNVIAGGTGNDLLVGGEAGDTITAGDPTQTTISNGNDTIYGDTGSTTPLVAGNDRITGNAGNDLIYPGSGTNTVDPGSGPGTQVFSPGIPAPAAYAATPIPEAPPAAPGAATLPGGVPTTGIWANLAGGAGSTLGTPAPNSVTAVVASATTRYVAWIDTRTGVPAVYVATETGGVWGQLAGSAQNYGISGLLGAAAAPAIALLANGQPIVAWTEQTRTGTDIQVAMFNGTAWVALGTSLSAGGISATGKATAPQILLVSGQPTVVWLDTTGGVANVYAKQWNDTGWVAVGTGAASGSGISASSLAVTEFATATDGTNLAVAWTQSFASGPTQIYLKQYNGTVWSALGTSASGNGLSNALYAASAPTLAYFGGTLFAAWQQYVTNPAQALTIFQQAPVIYAADYTGGTWQAAGTGALTGFGVSGNPDIATTPKLSANGGQLLLAWSDAFVDGGVDTHLYVKTWNGTSFAEKLPSQASGEGVARSTEGLDGLSLTVDPNGDPFAVWIDPGQTAAGLQVIGTPSLPAAVTVVASGASLQTVLAGANAGAGDVIYLRAGTYAGAVTIGPANAGVTIVGEPGLGAHLAGTLTITGANVTLQGVTVVGAINASGAGFVLRDSMQTTGTLTLTGTGQSVFDNRLMQGVSLQGAAGFELRGNTIATTGTGIEIGVGNNGLIESNTITGAAIGIDIANNYLGLISGNLIENGTVGINYFAAAALIGNRVLDNHTGIVATVNNDTSGLGFAPGSGVNTVSGGTLGVQLSGQMQDQLITGNATGVSGSGTIGGTDLSLANDISGNAVGIGGFTGTVQYSRIERNGIGIEATSNLLVIHNLITRNTTAGLDINGVTDIRTSDNTFYAVAGDNIHIAGGASNVEVLNSILWAETGYDIYVANNSQAGFFSDYNDLYAGATGRLVYWTRDFTDILDWQADVALYDLHSVGRTVVHPTDGKPHFVDLNNDDYRLLPVIGGQNASDAALEQGDPIVEYDTLQQAANLLADAGFENGLTGWTTDSGAQASVASGNPAPYDGSGYFFAGASVAPGYAQQTVDLIKSGYTAALLDGGTLNATFGGYTRSLAETPADAGSITITFLDASGTGVLGTQTVNSTNPTGGWTLTFGTIALPTGTRFIAYQFNSTHNAGHSADAFLDDAFITLSPGTGPQSALPGIGANYLTNPGFESGLDGWSANTSGSAVAAGQQTGYPAAYDGSDYFGAGGTQQGFVQQTVNLVASGLSAGQIDSGTLDLVFGGRVRSGAAFPADQGQITVVFLAANGTTQLGTETIQAPNTTDRWALVGGKAALPSGTRFVQYTFTATRQPGETYDESFLDDAFVSTVTDGLATPAGAYQAAAVADTTSGAARIALTSPVLHVNWLDNVPHTITWDSFGTADAPTQSVRIDLYQQTATGLALLANITPGVSNTGSYTWIPTAAVVPPGTYGLFIQVSLVSDPGVFDRSTEPFTVPETGSTYYVNDTYAPASDQYTTAVGSNRNDGKTPSQPLPDPDNVLRNYALSAGSTIFVDPGTYDLIDPFEISGNLDYGLGIDQGFTVQGPTGAHPAAILTPAIPGNPVNLIQLEDANLVTINNLTLTGAGRGVYVQNSTGFSSTGLTITAMQNEGVRIDTNSTVTTLTGLSVSGSGLAGVYIAGNVGSIIGADITNNGTAVTQYQANTAGKADGLYITGTVGSISGIFSGNVGWGVYLSAPGAVHITSSTIFGNGEGGLYLYDYNTGTAVIGDATLANGDGNVIYNNASYGIYAFGSAVVAGNIVYGETGTYGIEAAYGATATENVVYGSQDGIKADGSGAITANRVYDNSRYGIYVIDDVSSGGLNALTISDNVIYSNTVGIFDDPYYAISSLLIANNEIFANTTAAISVVGQSGVSIVNNTIDQPTGDGVDLSGGNKNTTLRNNILVIGTGSAISVAADSEVGFASDYNLFYITGAGGIGTWETVLRVTLAAWNAASFTDFDSIAGDPQFVNPLGAAGVLGYVSAAQPGYDDDFHLQSKTQDFAGGSLAPIIGVSGKPVFPTIAGGTDATQSPGIDRGAATDPVGNEPAPNGNYINLGDYGGTAQASESLSQFVLVLAPGAGATVQTGLATTISWRAFGFTGTVDLSYSADGGTTFTTIATGIADSGTYGWTVPVGLTPGPDYVVKVAASSDASVSGLSGVFIVSGQITKYYVNDSSTTGDVYTTAVGNDTNNGLTAATPKATLQALLSAYSIAAGATIYVDTGVYGVTTNIVLTAANSGTGPANVLTIMGPGSGPGAVLNRGNPNTGQDVFSLQTASYITLENLTIQGANIGVELSGRSVGDTLLNDTIKGNGDAGVLVDVNNGGTATAVDGLVVQTSLIQGNGLDVPYGPNYGSNQSGVAVLQGNGAVQLLNDTVAGNNQYGVYFQDGYLGAGVSTIDGGAYYGQTGAYGNEGYGIDDQTGSLIENALVYNNHNDGIDISNNSGYSATPPGHVTGDTVYGNGGAGIEASSAIVTGNLVYDQTNTGRNAIELNSGSTGTGNTVYGSANGIFLGGGALALDNLVYGSSGSGIDYSLSAPAGVTGNTVFGNNIGISGGLYYTGPVVPIDNNLVYDNVTAGIALGGGEYQNVFNNTIDEAQGAGITVTHNYSGGGASYTTIENNILVVGGGPAISVEPDAEIGFVSDYNLFDVTGSGAIGNWENLSYTSLANWYYELGLDQHSLTGDPLFVGAPSTTPTVIDANTANSAFTLTDSAAWTALPGNAGVGGLSYETTTYGPTAAANWTFTGLTVGEVYEVSATWSANTNTGYADYAVTDGTSNVLASARISQYGSITSAITNNGTAYSLIGLFTATTTTAVVTLTDDINDYHTLNVIADAMLLQPLGTAGADFHVQTGSPTIDAGDPTTPFLLEPGPNGGRVNLGYDGGTPQAHVSPSATTIDVLSPAGLAKYQIGEQLPVNFQTEGLLTSQPILLLHAGGAAIGTALQGNWSGDAFRNGGLIDNYSTAQIAAVGTLASVPAALFTSGAAVNSSTAGQKMSFGLPVADGTYTLTLYFADPIAGNVGYRVFNIIANGTTIESNFDIFATAKAAYGNGNDAISETFTITVSGGSGLELDFVNAAGYYGALVNGIQLNAPEAGTASPTATVSVLTNGLNYTPIATNVAINAFGQGQFIWTVNNDSSGGATRIKVASGAVSGASQPFLLANSGTVFYVNDALQGNEQYTSAAGNDINSGKSPGQPLASLAALLRAYPILPGDTIEIDSGVYTLASNVTLPAADSGTAAKPVVIIGPILPGTSAVLNRNNLSAGTDVFDLIGASNIKIAHLTIEGGYDGIDITTGANNDTLLSDVFTLNKQAGLDVPDYAGVTNLVVQNSQFVNNGSLVYYYGAFYGYGNTGVLFANDVMHDTLGIGLYLKGINQTVQGGAYYDNVGTGIYLQTAGLVEDALAYGNAVSNGNGGDGIYASSGSTVTGSTAFGNRNYGIDATGALISDNLVYDEPYALPNSSAGIALNYLSTGIGNTVYGNNIGIYVSQAVVQDNLVFDNAAIGIQFTLNPPTAITANTIYGNGIGISGGEYYTGPVVPIDGNLIYENTTAGIQLSGGLYQQIVNNTIEQPIGTGIALSGSAVSTTIENNIFSTGAGAALTIAPNSEIGLFSDYNFYNLTGTGSIAAWEGAAYTLLPAWYYATGQDQHSQTGNPGFVLPAGADGVLGVQALSPAPQVVSNHTTTGVWTAYTGGSGGYAGGAIQTAANSAGTATWSVNGLTVGGIYQVAVNFPSNSFGNTARYIVTDANGIALGTGAVSQNGASSGITSGGVGFALIGLITATTGTLTVTISEINGNPIVADAILVQQVGINRGADDDFHVNPGSPTIDMGDPLYPPVAEPSPNGGRVNLGYDGGTSQAQTSGAAQTLQVTNPTQFAKYEVGETVPIGFTSSDLGQIQPTLLIHAGGAVVNTTTQGDWLAGAAYQTSGTTFQNSSTTVVPVAGIPASLLQYGATASNSTAGTALNFFLPAASGTYTLRLFFADPSAYAAGQRVFNVIVNGVTMQANYDVFVAAGGENKGVELDLMASTQTLNGTTGFALSLVNVSGYYGAFVNAIELDHIVAARAGWPGGARAGFRRPRPCRSQPMRAPPGAPSHRRCRSTVSGKASSTGWWIAPARR
jgi:Ca2+-binding RTX toxin-like protein